MAFKKNTDFVIYGTFRAQEADILEQELEKGGVPVKALYPGTSVGREVTAGIYFPAYQLMIRACDFYSAEKIREKFNIEAVRNGEKMPLPKTYAWANKNSLSRFSLLGCLVSWLGALISGYFSYTLFHEKTQLYFITAFFIFAFIWFFSTVYNLLKEKKNR